MAKIATFKEFIETRSGKSESGKYVFVAMKGRNFTIVKRYSKPTLGATHEMGASKIRAAAKLWKELPESFKDELQRYSELYNRQIQEKIEYKGFVHRYNIFIKALASHVEPLNDLESLVSTLGNTIEAWMERGYLPQVKKTGRFEVGIV